MSCVKGLGKFPISYCICNGFKTSFDLWSAGKKLSGGKDSFINVITCTAAKHPWDHFSSLTFLLLLAVGYGDHTDQLSDSSCWVLWGQYLDFEESLKIIHLSSCFTTLWKLKINGDAGCCYEIVCCIWWGAFSFCFVTCMCAGPSGVSTNSFTDVIVDKKGNDKNTVLCCLAGRFMSLPQTQEKFRLFFIFVLCKRQKCCMFFFWGKGRKKQFAISWGVDKSAEEQGERCHHCQIKRS